MSRTRLQTARHRYYLEAGGLGSYLIKIKKRKKKERKSQKEKTEKLKKKERKEKQKSFK